ncbi:hypothetical protein NF212_08155 [Parasalinivibrio latis]|uniref:hypothetical protein n=1 Tax=Parasalinivibrio latis TaxID=2952610 RepID=UPI0030E02F88
MNVFPLRAKTQSAYSGHTAMDSNQFGFMSKSQSQMLVSQKPMLAAPHCAMGDAGVLNLMKQANCMNKWITIIDPSPRFTTALLEKAGINISKVRVVRSGKKYDQATLVEKSAQTGTSSLVVAFGAAHGESCSRYGETLFVQVSRMAAVH